MQAFVAASTQVFVAPSTIEKIFRATIPLTGFLREVAVLLVALPLAFPKPFMLPLAPKPFPALTESAWIARDASSEAPSLIPVPTLVERPAVVEPDAPPLATLVSLPASETAPRVLPPEIKELAPAVSISEAEVIVAIVIEIAPQEKRPAGIMDEVDEYLWEVYRRSPIKRDSHGDFTWKDPAAAQRFGVSMPAYVIGGMHPDFREQLYHAGRAMDAAGIRWSITSAFRDDYRQSLAAGFKAKTGYSLHGGSARTGGYGHGQAVDVAGEDGNASEVWQWIDRHGERFGLYRPMPGADPPHVQPRGSWQGLASTLRNVRVGATEQAQVQGTRTATASAAAEAW
jgi:hypothetical protein